jgi:8-amino-7-oxononanoate synthase
MGGLVRAENPNPFRPRLDELRERGRLRAVGAWPGLPGKFIEREGRSLLNFSSNDYLGLSAHPRVRRAAADAALALGTGSGGSRLLGGGLPIHRELEEAVAAMRPLGRALLFNTGFMANLGALQALAPILGPVYSDKFNHASLAEALRAMPGAFHRWRHGDLRHLESLLAAHQAGAAARGRGPGLICSETLFSMDGDAADVTGLLRLQERYGCWLYLDEAHSTGCLPELAAPALAAGNGRVLIMGTFGKAYGGFGAYLAGPADAIAWLENAARSFIFSTALPPSAAAAALEALRVAEEEPWRRERLAANAAYARDRFRSRGFDIGPSRSHIVPVIAGTDREAVRLSGALLTAGFHAPAVRPPTVPEGSARLRINLTASIERQDIDALAEALAAARDAGPAEPPGKDGFGRDGDGPDA